MRKCHLLLSTQDCRNIQIVNSTILKRSKSKNKKPKQKNCCELNWITIEFNPNIENIGLKARRKFNAVSKLPNEIELSKRYTLINQVLKLNSKPGRVNL